MSFILFVIAIISYSDNLLLFIQEHPIWFIFLLCWLINDFTANK